MATECGMEPDAAQKILRGPVERDGDLIRGVVGLSLNEFSHSFTVDGNLVCARPTLYRPGGR
jgi:hypothetical protein